MVDGIAFRSEGAAVARGERVVRLRCYVIILDARDLALADDFRRGRDVSAGNDRCAGGGASLPHLPRAPVLKAW